MGTPDNQREYGPSWGDVREHILEVRKAHNRPITIELAVNDLPAAPPYLFVTVVSWDITSGPTHVKSTAKSHQWPSGDWKSMPAMILALLFQLDEALTDWERVRTRQSSF